MRTSLFILLPVFSLVSCASSKSSRDSNPSLKADPARHALAESKAAQGAHLEDSANACLREAVGLFKQSADLGNVDAIQSLVSSHTYSVGVDEEYLAARENIYVYYRIGGRLAAGSGRGEAFQEKAREMEIGRSAFEVQVMNNRVEAWFEVRPWLSADSVIRSGFRDSSRLKLSSDSLLVAAKGKIERAFEIHKLAAEEGHLPSIVYLAKAYRYGIGVDGELWALVAGGYFYDRIGARLAEGTELGGVFQARVDAYEAGKSDESKRKAREKTDAWLKSKPWLPLGRNKE